MVDPSSVLDQLTPEDIARLSPANFLHYANPRAYQMRPHSMLIDDAIVNWAFGLNGAKPRLILTCPPSVGKSTTATVGGGSWAIGTFPGKNILLSSYQDRLARDFSSDIQGHIDAHGEALWDVKLVPDRKAADSWRTNTGSRIWCSGIGGGTAGRPLDFWFIDDPIKDEKEAESLSFRDGQWNWWLSTARTRMRAVTKVMIILTRWNPDDIVGRILDDPHERDLWDVLRIPALSEGEGDPLERPKEESIWEEVWPAEDLKRMREQNRRWFECLFQGSPIVKEGTTLKAEWFAGDDYVFEGDAAKGRHTVDSEALPKDLELVCGWDLAATEGGNRDETVGFLMGRSKNLRLLYLLDLMHGRWSTARRNTNMARQIAKWELQWGRSRILHYFQQDPGGGGKDQLQVIEMTLKKAGELVVEKGSTEEEPIPHYVPRWTSDPVSHAGSKDSRIERASEEAENGNYRMLEGPWNRYALERLVGYTGGKNEVDDVPDGWSWGARRLTLAGHRVRRSYSLF